MVIQRPTSFNRMKAVLFIIMLWVFALVSAQIEYIERISVMIWNVSLLLRHWRYKNFALEILRSKQNGKHFGNSIFQWVFLTENLYWKFMEICMCWSNKQYVSVALGDGLAPNRCQANIWSNNGHGSMPCGITRPQWVSSSASPYVDGLVQDCSISIANALEILQSFTKPSIYMRPRLDHHRVSRCPWT